jgi:hypothetical protein
MKNIIFGLAITLVSFTTINNPKNRIGVSGPLKFNKTSYLLAWSDQPTDTYYIQEYLPQGETLEKFNQMMTIHLFNTDLKIKDAVEQKIEELKKRQQTDAVCNYMISENNSSKETIVDFIVSESKDDKLTILEFNIYRYKQIEISKKEKAILVYTYSKRAYGDDITPFFETLGDERTKLLKEMMTTTIPSITLVADK